MEGITLGNLGIAYGALGDYTKATEYFEQSRVIFEDRLNVIFPFKAVLDAAKHRKLN
jgi:tetratricopeptide (TPR) repeat protein